MLTSLIQNLMQHTEWGKGSAQNLKYKLHHDLHLIIITTLPNAEPRFRVR